MVEEQRHGFRAQEWIVFSVGLAGIFLGTLFLASYEYLLGDLDLAALRTAIGNAAMLTAAATILLWAFYEISIKHNHPRWHKVFFLLAGKIVGTGVFLLLLSLTMLFLIVTQEVLYTLAAAVLIGGIFAASVIAMELTYALLRRKYESVTPKHPGRMFFWGIAIGLVCAALLLIGAWQAQVLVVKGANSNLQHLNVAKQEVVDHAAATVSALPASPLKSGLEEKVRAAQAVSITPLPPPTFSEVISDRVVENRCGQLQESTIPLYSLLRAVSTVEPAQAESVAPLSSPIRYKPFDDMMSCLDKVFTA